MSITCFTFIFPFIFHFHGFDINNFFTFDIINLYTSIVSWWVKLDVVLKIVKLKRLASAVWQLITLRMWGLCVAGPYTVLLNHFITLYQTTPGVGIPLYLHVSLNGSPDPNFKDELLIFTNSTCGSFGSEIETVLGFDLYFYCITSVEFISR